jgi:iron complex outermembrane receptor protein
MKVLHHQVVPTTRGQSILAGSFLFTLLSASAVAADNAAAPGTASVADAGDQLSEVVVTGTQIRGVAPIGAPVITVDQQEIVESGLNSTADILHDIPQVTTLGAGEIYNGTNQNASLDTNRDNAINIRGLGPQATLTLVDGRRTPNGGASGNLYDPSSIPTIALGSIDLLSGGASAIYGSDAVAGVANLVLRKDFQGLEADGTYGTAEGFDTRKFGAIFGQRWSGGSVMVAFENSNSGQLLASQRPNLTQCDVAGVNSCSVDNPTYGNVTFSNAPTAYKSVPLTNTGTGITQAQLAAGATYFNQAQDSAILPASNRNSFVWNVQQDAAPNIRLWTEGYFTQNDQSFPQGQFALAGTVGSANPGYIPLVGNQTSEKGYVSLDDYLGPEYRSGFERAYQAAIGVDVALPHDWTFSLYGEHNYNFEYTNTQGLNTTVEPLAFACTTPGLCFDPFGPYATNQAAINQMVGNQYFHYVQQEDLGNIKLDGTLFRLPGGDVKLAVGGEVHHDTLADLSLNTEASPTVAVVHTAADFDAARTVASVFGEAVIPVFGPNNELPFLKSFVIDAAGRFDHYSDVGSTANPKISFNWNPVADLSFRGEYGTSFRAPTLCDTNAGCSGSDFTSTVTYPGFNAITIVGGNPAVKPETARTWDFGPVYKSSWLPGLSASLDYWGIDYSSVISTPGFGLSASQIANPIYSSLVIHNPTQAYLSNLTLQPWFIGPTTFTTSQTTLVVIGTRQNAGEILTHGLDFKADYRWLSYLGAWSMGVAGTYVKDYDYSVERGLPRVPEINKFEYPVHWRFRTKSSWSSHNLTAVAYVNYTGGYINNSATDGIPLNTGVSPFVTVDATLLYKITQPELLDGFANNTTISLSMLNLFNAAPPYALTGTTTEYDAEQANPLGREIFIALKKTF